MKKFLLITLLISLFSLTNSVNASELICLDPGHQRYGNSGLEPI